MEITDCLQNGPQSGNPPPAVHALTRLLQCFEAAGSAARRAEALDREQRGRIAAEIRQLSQAPKPSGGCFPAGRPGRKQSRLIMTLRGCWTGRTSRPFWTVMTQCGKARPRRMLQIQPCLSAGRKRTRGCLRIAQGRNGTPSGAYPGWSLCSQRLRVRRTAAGKQRSLHAGRKTRREARCGTL